MKCKVTGVPAKFCTCFACKGFGVDSSALDETGSIEVRELPPEHTDDVTGDPEFGRVLLEASGIRLAESSIQRDREVRLAYERGRGERWGVWWLGVVAGMTVAWLAAVVVL